MGSRVRHVRTITNVQATKKVEKLRSHTNVDDLAELLGISKKTLYKRMDNGVWKLTERTLIEKIEV